MKNEQKQTLVQQSPDLTSVSSPDELHSGDHVVYQATVFLGSDGYRSALVLSEPEHDLVKLATNTLSGEISQKAVQFSSLRHLQKVQYTPCLYSGEQAVQRARGRELCYSMHEFVSLIKTGVTHSDRTILYRNHPTGP